MAQITAKNLISQIFTKAYEQNASDVHFAADRVPFIRIDGRLKPLDGYNEFNSKQISQLAYSLIPKELKNKFLTDWDMDFSYEDENKIRYRVNLHLEKGNVGMTARIVPSEIPSMADLDLPKIVYDLIQKPAGLVLVTGPTGSGKSTTLASIIETINQTRASHIVTLEDPIEFIYKSKKSIVKQRQLGSDVSSFGQGLKHVLRQDPNIIMVGEMRDLETISTTITLAETGHLVFATLHTDSASQTIDRIIDIFPPHQQAQLRLQLSITLKAVIAQRLLPRIGGGRVAAREILINNSGVSNVIRENKITQLDNMLQTGMSDGMFSMDQSLLQLVENEVIDESVALNYLKNKNLLDN